MNVWKHFDSLPEQTPLFLALDYRGREFSPTAQECRSHRHLFTVRFIKRNDPDGRLLS